MCATAPQQRGRVVALCLTTARPPRPRGGSKVGVVTGGGTQSGLFRGGALILELAAGQDQGSRSRA